MNFIESLKKISTIMYADLFTNQVIRAIKESHPCRINPATLPNSQDLYDYYKHIEFIKIYLSQRHLSELEKNKIQEFLITAIDKLHRDWLQLLIWHIIKIQENHELFNCLTPQQKESYKRACQTTESFLTEYYELMAAPSLKEGCFFPAQNLCTEIIWYFHLQSSADVVFSIEMLKKFLGYAITSWIDFRNPEAIALILKIKKSKQLKDYSFNIEESIKLIKPEFTKPDDLSWFKDVSAEFLSENISTLYFTYLSLQPGMGELEQAFTEIERKCVKLIKNFGNLIGYYYESMIIFASPGYDISVRYHNFEEMLYYFLYLKKHTNSFYHINFLDTPDSETLHELIDKNIKQFIGKKSYFSGFSQEQIYTLKLFAELILNKSVITTKYLRFAKNILENPMITSLLNEEQHRLLQIPALSYESPNHNINRDAEENGYPSPTLSRREFTDSNESFSTPENFVSPNGFSDIPHIARKRFHFQELLRTGLQLPSPTFARAKLPDSKTICFQHVTQHESSDPRKASLLDPK